MRAKRKATPKLTRRQHQCLILVAKGKTDTQIGRLLRISEETVHKHIEVAKKRYRVHSRIRLVVRALQWRQIQLKQIV